MNSWKVAKSDSRKMNGLRKCGPGFQRFCFSIGLLAASAVIGFFFRRQRFPSSTNVIENSKSISIRSESRPLAERVAEFDAMNAKLVGPDAYDSIVGRDCGYPNKAKDCPRWYQIADIKKSASVDDPDLIQLMAKRMAERTQSLSGECRPSITGGWCLYPQVPPKFYAAGTQNISISVNHVPPSMRVVIELSAMIAEEGIRSINDFGAGVGQYKAALKDAFPDLRYRAYDGSGNVEEFTNGFLSHFDLTLPLHLPKADWVMSLEVGEHVSSKYEGMIIRNLHSHNCKGILLSWAVLGQQGHRHINNHSPEHIISVFEELGYSHDLEKSKKFKNANGNHFWFTRSVLVFRRNQSVC